MSFTFFGWESVSDTKNHLKSDQEPERGGSYTMYHGTYLRSAKDIISNGFKPSRDGLLGAGVYISRDINKAMCYPVKTDKKDKVVFKLKVRVGKVKKIDSDNHPLQKSWHQNGYDTAWVPPKSNITTIKSGREEDCVWDPKRITIADIAFCMDNQTKQELRKLLKKPETKNAGSTEENCQICEKGKERFHPVEKCWGCKKVICPFMDRHVCKKRN
ncbi:uncharacterized protein LOC135352571 [Latimeria chalumnae]|uniref:uncharacterized protein LOC135352571 n=1 Tax=Latimeria chalumnae TaxID=7897 RepID=UPI00313E5702